jgi:tetratricopeptide (TPR) repeat protein
MLAKLQQRLTQKQLVFLLLLILFIGAIPVALLWAVKRSTPTPAQPQLATSTVEQAEFVDNDACAECHADYVAAWAGSHHAQAMQPANAQTVLGDFDDASFTAFGVTSRFFKEGDAFVVNTQGSDGKYADFTVKYTFGVKPLQQYLLAFPNGRLQAFAVAWDTEKGRWFHLYPDEEIKPNDPLHWTHRHFTWNSACAECHSTDLKLNYDLDTDTYATSWAEINVSCQACHGPGANHVAWAKAEERVEEDPQLVVDYGAMDSQEQVETCARCHSRRYPISQDDQPGRPFLDDFMPELLREGLYHADGQILEEAFEYGSFLQSKMYQRGVGCTHCHNPHTLELHQPGNALCTACHQPNLPTEKFPTLQAKVYDAPAHHFHPVGSAGAQCVNCHMPAQTYMVIDPRRDHSLRIPRPDLSITLGTPNACTQCHTDQPPAWAMAAMNKWYGDTWERPHYGEVLAAGRDGVPDGAMALRELVNDQEQPTIVRATALDLLRNYGDLGLETFKTAITADASLLRAVAVQGLASLPDQEKLNLLAPRLNDPILAVRIEAAKELALVPQATLAQVGERQRTAFDAALAEYVAAQLAQAGQPEGHANLGRLYTVLGDLEKAEAAYQTAIARDRFFFQAHNNLANLYYQQGRQDKAEQILHQGLASSPEAGVLYYTLGLLLAEQERFDEAVQNFDRAASLMQDVPRVHYNYGLLLQKVRRFTDALAALQRAYQLAPYDPEILYALITFHMQAGEWKQALPYAKKLATHYPDVPKFQELVASLRSNQ